MSRRMKTEFAGVRYRQHHKRKHGLKPDAYFSIRYRLDGKQVEEGLGWASKGWTASKAALQLAELQEAHRKGSKEPATLRQRREIARMEREKQEKKGITFGDYFLNTFIPQAEIEKPRETKGKMIHYRRWIKEAIGALPFSEIGVLELEKIKTDMLTAGRAPRTIACLFSTIRRIWNDARLKGIVSEDSPTKKIKIILTDNKRARYFTHNEADQYLNELKNKDESLWKIALISLHCGLRFGEIAGLRIGDIDTQRGIIGIRDSKGGFARYGRMTGEVKEVFSGIEGNREELIFKDANGNRMARPSKVFTDAICKLNFNDGVIDRRQKLTFHSLRHTYASWLVDRGVGLYDVQRLLGHKSIELTQRYSHLSDDRLANDVKELEKGIQEARKKVVSINR